MNASLLKRFFKAITSDDQLSIELLSKKIIEDEERKGHVRLAKELEAIVQNEATRNRFKRNSNLNSLPQSRRDNQPLAVVIERENLRHHMLLPYREEQRLQRIEKEFAARARLASFNLIPRRKILLYGAPGCGKTMAAERLAWNIGLPLLKVRFDSLISSYFGETSSNLRAIFEMSEKNPCVLLLDECDIIAKSRAIGQDVGEIPRIVNMLLMLLDEYDSQGLLVATTNLEGALDRAIYRRFDDIIELEKPTSELVTRLLKMTLSAINLEKEINWDHLVEKMKGFSSANVVSVAENAAKIAILYGDGVVTHLALEQAIEEMKSF